MKTSIILSVLLLAQSTVFSATIYVPDDYSKIQDAINVSVNGDTIIVRPGTYMENINFLGKAITVKSEKGADVTIIDGNQAGSVVTFQNQEDEDSIIEGFTIFNGNASGIFCDNSSPVIGLNIIKDNSALQGGGISCNNSSPEITNNFILNNSADSDDGGGIATDNYSSPIITYNFITSNIAFDEGGGIQCDDYSSPEISYNTIISNSAKWGGGIECIDFSSPIISNNIIKDNEASSDGGGILLKPGCSPSISQNIILSNTATSDGGGMFSTTEQPAYVSNNIISLNTAGNTGGGTFCHNSPLILTNNTITQNSASYGGGFFCKGVLSSPAITNTVFFYNTSSIHGNEIYVGDYSTLAIRYSDIEGGQTSVFVEPTSTLNWGDGMINADPLFVDSTNEDFHLTWNSPCRNSGDNLTPGMTYEDFEGDHRIWNGVVDIGADEFHHHLYHTGAAIPGNTIDIKIIGTPTNPVNLYLGSGVQAPPLVTPYGYLYLVQPPLIGLSLGIIPINGVLIHTAPIPLSWTPGDDKPLQALVGPLGNIYNSKLTNLLLLKVE